jgi:chemotaxis protein methyltransferase CheR
MAAATFFTDEHKLFLASVLMRRSGCALPESGEHLLSWRLKQIAWQYNFLDLDELIGSLRDKKGTPLEDEVVAALMDTDSWFFRDEPKFQKIQGHVLPALRALRATDKRLSFWVPGCGRGQEVYSLILTVRHHFPAVQDWGLRVLGTDVLADCVKQASTGTFTDDDVRRGLPLSLVARHFDRIGKDWALHSHLRAEAEFQHRNVIEGADAKPQRFDLVVASNLLPSLDELYREHVTQVLEQHVLSKGFLLLGEPELKLGIRPRPKVFKDCGGGLFQLLD